MKQLSQGQSDALIALRHALHQSPEISGQEKQTAARICAELEQIGADRIWTGLGGHGVAAEFTGKADGPTVMLRCELDGLPIQEQSERPYKSQVDGKGHLCGHDGHMCSMLAVGYGLADRDFAGRVILLFQPAEETGAGAQAVISDPRWSEIRPDYAFAYHNVPGRPLGEVGLRSGPGNCASRGMQILLHGKSSHAAAPEDGVSPGPAMAQLMQTLPALAEGQIGEEDFALVTLTHANLGEPAFGIAPGEGEVRVTLRTMSNTRMARLVSEAEMAVARAAPDLVVQIHWHDVFPAVENAPEATEIVQKVATRLQMPVLDMATPMRWSEDFGHIGTDGATAALIYVGAGEDHPQLHNPDYDFPDDLIALTSALFLGIVDDLSDRT